MALNGLPESSRKVLEVLALNLGEEALRVSDISKLVQYSRQTIYQDLEELLDKGLIIRSESGGVSVFKMSSEELRWEILGTAKERQEIFSKQGTLKTSYRIHSISKPVFCDPAYLPDSLSSKIGGKAPIYGCSMNLKPIPISQIALLLGFQERLDEVHMSLMGSYWAIESYGSNEHNIGVGVKNLIQMLPSYDRAVIRLVFTIEEDLGGYFGMIYFLEGRKLHHTINSLKLTVLSPKIPIGKSFVTDWENTGILPYIETYRVKRMPLLTKPIRINSEHIVGFISDPRYKRKVATAAILQLPKDAMDIIRSDFRTIIAWAPLPLISLCLEKGEPMFLTHFIRFITGPKIIPAELRDCFDMYFGLLSSPAMVKLA